MTCATLASYNGRLDDVLRRCCPGEAPASASPGTSLDRFPTAPGSTLPSTKRSSPDVSTGIYRHASGGSPFWDVNVGSDAGRAQVCSFLANAAASAPSDSVTEVRLAGSTREQPAFLARWRSMGPIRGARVRGGGAEGDAAAAAAAAAAARCEAAMGELPELTAELLRAKVRHRAGRYLTQLGAQRYDTDRTYAQWAAGSSGGAGFSGAPFEAQVAEWTNRLQDELSQAANRLNAARSAVLESCWAADAVASPPAASAGGPRTAAMPATMGRYGRAMAELLTAGMDSDPLQTSGGAAGSLWRSDGRLVGSSEDEALNSAGMVMCSTLPALVLGDEGLEPWEVRWWRDEGAVGACFPEAPRQQWGGLRDLLEPSGSAGAGPRPLDALRLLSSWGSPRQGLANVPECGRRVAALHRSLHNLAAFYYDSPLFARSKAADPGCRFEGAGAAAGAGAGAGASACPGVTALCGGLQGTEDPDALGGGQLSFATAGLLTTESLRRLLASRGETDADLELDVALARALATNKEQVCWSTQWSDVERDEDGRLVSCPSFCNRDMRVPWLTSQDPGRSQCGTAWAMFSNDDSLGTILTEWPPQAERKYCREPPAVAPDSCRIEIGGKRVSTDNREHLYCEACCCGDGESEDCTYRGALPEAHRLCDFPATA